LFVTTVIRTTLYGTKEKKGLRNKKAEMDGGRDKKRRGIRRERDAK
jgi:hypothetical protein